MNAVRRCSTLLRTVCDKAATVARAAQLDILFVCHFPPSNPSFGAQRRNAGLMAALSRRHRIGAIALITPEFDPDATVRAMREYCSEVILVSEQSRAGAARRWLQLRSLGSSRSYDRLLHDRKPLRDALRGAVASGRWDVVNVEQPFIGMAPLAALDRIAPSPALVLDEHNVEFDLARQQASGTLDLGIARRTFNALNWRKLRREELELWRRFDGVSFCSIDDESRARRLVPSIRSAVVPNAVDVHHFQPRATDPKPDGRTLLFLGALNYFPNVDAVLYLLKQIWPAIASRNPDARLKVVGQFPTPELLAFRGPRVEFTGRVDDVRPHLAEAAATLAPLRIGGGTRFKILEAMSMSKAVVATSIGAEGIDAEHGRHLLVADDPAAFAAAAARLLDDAGLAQRIGHEGRALVEARYSWEASVRPLEALFCELRSAPRRRRSASPRVAAGAR